MSMSGRELMALLEKDGWLPGGRRTHGMFYSKLFPGEARPRSTVVPDISTPLQHSTLGAILSVKQTGLGQSKRILIEPALRTPGRAGSRGNLYGLLPDG